MSGRRDRMELGDDRILCENSENNLKENPLIKFQNWIPIMIFCPKDHSQNINDKISKVLQSEDNISGNFE